LMKIKRMFYLPWFLKQKDLLEKTLLFSSRCFTGLF
jgi:hypothetical protein